MITWTAFKTSNGLQEGEKVPFMQAKGKEFAVVGDKTVIISPNFDESKEAFVIEITKDKLGNPLTNVYSLCNTAAVVTRVL